ncbi:DUF397 domain-containing protein [Streptomyces cyaneofuscatus]|uniref:DUF397 domain-containing protein n=1 Tax=Streptomyces cyaneofuscatus TaxID=66883 RepID=UPI002D78D1FA|nr:DUF397 domain-containing protein [Streptomyces cyaneofuscatus]WRO10247.1 DUF397 domain-containing protein [Streptomyces cyaneofuscatus]
MARKTTHSTSPRSGRRKSSYSNGDGGSCLEVQDYHPTAVPVRDSKVPGGPALLVPAAGWSAFVTAVRDGSL